MRYFREKGAEMLEQDTTSPDPEHSDSIIKCLGIAFSYVVAPKRAVCL